jgi:hypothetical protein
VWEEYRRILAAAQAPSALAPIVKWDFHKAVASDDHVLTIQTADPRFLLGGRLRAGPATASSVPTSSHSRRANPPWERRKGFGCRPRAGDPALGTDLRLMQAPLLEPASGVIKSVIEMPA